MKFVINASIVVFVLFLFYATYQLKDFRIIKQKNEIEIINKEIIFDAQRKLLTAIYREKHTGDCDHRRDGIDYCVNIKPEIIVVHMAGLKSLDEVFKYMKEPVLRNERTALEQRSYDRLNVSAHFVIDRNGEIYSFMPENYMARHAIGINHASIAIENVGYNGEETEAQIQANIVLIKYLKNKYDIKKIISHGEIEKLKNTKYFVENYDGYFREKKCGNSLAEKIRNLLYK